MITNKLQCITNGSNYQFLSGITPKFLEIEDYIEKIADLCKENKLQKIYFLEFKALKISTEFLIRKFQNVQISIFVIQNWVKQVQKVAFGTNIVDSISEQNSLKTLNILTEDPKFIEKFRALAVKTDKAEGKP